MGRRLPEARIIPRLPRARSKYQFQLKTFLIAALLAGPVLAVVILAAPHFLAPEDRIPLAKLIATGAIAFIVIPVLFANIRPGFGLFSAFLLTLFTLHAWSTANFHFTGLAATGALGPSGRQVGWAVGALELACVLTAMLVGTVAGSLVSLFSRD